MSELPTTGFLRMHQIIGDKKRGIPALIPISKSSWWKGVKDKKYPQPTRALGPRITAWSVESIRGLIESANQNGGAK
jgi:prophage regulatory protein